MSAFAPLGLRRDRLRSQTLATRNGQAEGLAQTKLARSASEVWWREWESWNRFFVRFRIPAVLGQPFQILLLGQDYA